MSSKVTLAELELWCKSRGYEPHMRSGDGSTRILSKQFEHFNAALIVNLPKGSMELVSYPHMFRLTSTQMSFGHPRFDSLFETRMVRMMNAIIADDPTAYPE